MKNIILFSEPSKQEMESTLTPIEKYHEEEHKGGHIIATLDNIHDHDCSMFTNSSLRELSYDIGANTEHPKCYYSFYYCMDNKSLMFFIKKYLKLRDKQSKKVALLQRRIKLTGKILAKLN
jgi:hypothetical protein